MLEQVKLYNDFSPKLKAEIEARIDSFGKRVRYKFDIANRNPDPEKKGEVIYPFAYTLDPVTFSIVDKYEDRENKQKVKKVGIVETTKEDGNPEIFRRIRIYERDKGIKEFNLEKIEDRESVFYLELHPKLSGGLFADADKRQLISRIDEQAASKTSRTERTARVKALNVAQGMSDKELHDFADAMSWDSSDDVEILRNRVEELAETNPVFFNDLVDGKSLEYQAAITQAINNKLISFDPADYKFVWVGNNQTIVLLPTQGDKTEIQKMAEWLQLGGQKAEEVYKKIKSLLKGNKQPA